MRALTLAAAAVALVPSVSAQDPILTEFLASNSTGLLDGDGDTSDWLEVHNPTGTAIPLGGWHLTDDPQNLTKWTFPAVALLPDQHLVVFASDKDRAVAGQELHTNFKLTAGGEYLALVAPGGGRIATEFTPAFPPQVADVSYGFRSGTAEVVQAPTACSALVPANGALGTSWTQPGFQFTGGLTGQTGVGYSTNLPFGSLQMLNVGPAMIGINTSIYVRVPFSLTDVNGIASLSLRMLYNDGFVAFVNGREVARRNAPATPAWNSAATTARTWLQGVIPEVVDLSAGIPRLVQGANVLAFHGLNDSLQSQEFLVRPQLTVTYGYSAGPGRYFDPPTPGARNGAGYAGLVAEPSIHVAGGFYDNPFTVTMSAPDPGASIRYTTDGSPPTATTGLPYTGALTISGTTPLRARAFITDHLPSPVATSSYLFLNQVLLQGRNPPGFPPTWGSRSSDYEMDPQIVNDPYYGPRLRGALEALPTLSLVMSNDDLFGTSGIYRNPQSMGLAWERPVSVEYFPAPAGGGSVAPLQVDAGLRIHGGGSRDPNNTYKHSLRLLFRGGYGDPQLTAPLFGRHGADEFDVLVLRASYNDGWIIHPQHGDLAWTAYFRDEFVRQKQGQLGHVTARGTWMHLYINGLYWGVYNPCERPDEHFQVDYFGGLESEWDVVKHRDGVVVSGNQQAWNQLLSIARGGLASTASYAQFEQLIDPVNFVDYMVLNFFIGNEDWPYNNWYAARRRDPTGRFRFFTWDAERSMRNLSVNRTGANRDLSSGILYARARSNPEFRMLFADRTHRALVTVDAPLATAASRADATAEADRVAEALIAESARWGDTFRSQPFTVNGDWLTQRNYVINTYLGQRPGVALNQIRSAGLYPSVAAPSFSQHGGVIVPGFALGMSAPSGTIYYTVDGSDPRRPGGAVSASARSYSGPVALQATTRVKARALLGATWSALEEAGFVVRTFAINELVAINRNGPVDEAGEHEDWIELVNTTGATQVADGMFLSDDPGNLAKWAIPAGWSVPAGGRILVWADEDGGQGPLHANFKLAGSGETVILTAPDGLTVMDRIDFGQQVADVSTARLFDGDDIWVSDLIPTPLLSNDPGGCGVRQFAGLDMAQHPGQLSVNGTPRVGGAPVLQLTNGPAAGAAIVYASFAADYYDFGNGTIFLLGQPLFGPSYVTTAGGAFSLPFPIPNAPGLANLEVYLQSFDVAGTEILASNAVRVRICP